MSAVSAPVPTATAAGAVRATATSSRETRRLWRTAGALAIAHVVLMLAGFAFQRVAPLAAAPSAVVATLRDQPLGRSYAGVAIALVAFLVLLADVALLARLMRGRDETTRWLASLAGASGTVYVAVTLATAFAGATAALYATHQGADGSVVAALSWTHWFAVLVATGVLGLLTALIGALVWRTRALPRWVAVGAWLVGAVCLAGSVPGAGSLVDDSTLVWVVWFTATGIAAIRAGSRRSARA
jgi:hypothetical protein